MNMIIGFSSNFVWFGCRSGWFTHSNLHEVRFGGWNCCKLWERWIEERPRTPTHHRGGRTFHTLASVTPPSDPNTTTHTWKQHVTNFQSNLATKSPKHYHYWQDTCNDLTPTHGAQFIWTFLNDVFVGGTLRKVGMFGGASLFGFYKVFPNCIWFYIVLCGFIKFYMVFNGL